MRNYVITSLCSLQPLKASHMRIEEKNHRVRGQSCGNRFIAPTFSASVVFTPNLFSQSLPGFNVSQANPDEKSDDH